MKRKLIFLTIGLSAVLGVAFFLSILGHFKIWIFSNSLNNNLFIAGGIGFIMGIPNQSAHFQYARGLGLLYSGRKEKPEQHPGNEKSRFRKLLYLSLLFAIICALSFFLPDIKL